MNPKKNKVRGGFVLAIAAGRSAQQAIDYGKGGHLHADVIAVKLLPREWLRINCLTQESIKRSITQELVANE